MVVVAVVTVTVFLGGVGVGHAVGHHKAAATYFAVGQASSEQQEITVVSNGWAYAVSPSVPWLDGAGSWHDGGRPSCLPAVGGIANVHFSWVPYSLGSIGGRAVVAVDCSRAPAS